jgi:D-alanyl-D-alanine-carboxypeptidase/D-alanyl-D-alanine-endopeptidase
MPHLKITNMNKLLSFTVLILLFVSCETIQKSDKEDIHETNLSNYINKWLEQTGIPSASYIIVKNGKIQEAEAFGYANLKKRTPVDTSSIYSTGSNFKSVTSTAIMQLQAKGLIDIDSSVNKYFKTPIPNIDPKNPVTARQLMSHTSGIPSSISIYKLWERKPELTLKGH